MSKYTKMVKTVNLKPLTEVAYFALMYSVPTCVWKMFKAPYNTTYYQKPSGAIFSKQWSSRLTRCCLSTSIRPLLNAIITVGKQNEI